MKTAIIKIAMIVKRKGKYCVVGHRKDKNGKRRNFGCYKSRALAKKRLGQIYMFKFKKSELLNTIIAVADELNERSFPHIADAITNCLEEISKETIQKNTVIKLGKIINLLQKKNEADIADKLDALLPDILCFADCSCDAPKTKSRMTADKVYKVAMDLKEKYNTGLINECSFEYEKMLEFEDMLKMGFLLPPPVGYDDLPDDAENWLEHFKGKK